jgi:hypothetical protein
VRREGNHAADGVHFLNAAIFLSDIDYQVQELMPFIPGYSAPENYQIMLTADVKSAPWKLHNIIFDRHSTQREEFHGVDIAERLHIEIFYQVIGNFNTELRSI